MAYPQPPDVLDEAQGPGSPQNRQRRAPDSPLRKPVMPVLDDSPGRSAYAFAYVPPQPWSSTGGDFSGRGNIANVSDLPHKVAYPKRAGRPWFPKWSKKIATCCLPLCCCPSCRQTPPAPEIREMVAPSAVGSQQMPPGGPQRGVSEEERAANLQLSIDMLNELKPKPEPKVSDYLENNLRDNFKEFIDAWANDKVIDFVERFGQIDLSKSNSKPMIDQYSAIIASRSQALIIYEAVLQLELSQQGYVVNPQKIIELKTTLEQIVYKYSEPLKLVDRKNFPALISTIIPSGVATPLPPAQEMPSASSSKSYELYSEGGSARAPDSPAKTPQVPIPFQELPQATATARNLALDAKDQAQSAQKHVEILTQKLASAQRAAHVAAAGQGNEVRQAPTDVAKLQLELYQAQQQAYDKSRDSLYLTQRSSALHQQLEQHRKYLTAVKNYRDEVNGISMADSSKYANLYATTKFWNLVSLPVDILIAFHIGLNRIIDSTGPTKLSTAILGGGTGLGAFHRLKYMFSGKACQDLSPHTVHLFAAIGALFGLTINAAVNTITSRNQPGGLKGKPLACLSFTDLLKAGFCTAPADPFNQGKERFKWTLYISGALMSSVLAADGPTRIMASLGAEHGSGGMIFGEVSGVVLGVFNYITTQRSIAGSLTQFTDNMKDLMSILRDERTSWFACVATCAVGCVQAFSSLAIAVVFSVPFLDMIMPGAGKFPAWEWHFTSYMVGLGLGFGFNLPTSITFNNLFLLVAKKCLQSDPNNISNATSEEKRKFACTIAITCGLLFVSSVTRNGNAEGSVEDFIKRFENEEHIAKHINAISLAFGIPTPISVAAGSVVAAFRLKYGEEIWDSLSVTARQYSKAGDAFIQHGQVYHSHLEFQQLRPLSSSSSAHRLGANSPSLAQGEEKSPQPQQSRINMSVVSASNASASMSSASASSSFSAAAGGPEHQRSRSGSGNYSDFAIDPIQPMSNPAFFRKNPSYWFAGERLLRVEGGKVAIYTFLVEPKILDAPSVLNIFNRANQLEQKNLGRIISILPVPDKYIQYIMPEHHCLILGYQNYLIFNIYDKDLMLLPEETIYYEIKAPMDNYLEYVENDGDVSTHFKYNGITCQFMEMIRPISNGKKRK